jgi:hypothetical protein
LRSIHQPRRAFDDNGGVLVSPRRSELGARGSQWSDRLGKLVLAHEAVPELHLGEAVVPGERDGPGEERLRVLEPVGQQGDVAELRSCVRVGRILAQHTFEGPFGLVEPALAQELIGVVVWSGRDLCSGPCGRSSTRCAPQQRKRRTYAGSQPGSPPELSPTDLTSRRWDAQCGFPRHSKFAASLT